MKFAIVVCDYGHNLDWVTAIPSWYDIFIYHKTSKYTLYIEHNNIYHFDVPDVGRAEHTYLQHIVDNYDKLMLFDGIIFLHDLELQLSKIPSFIVGFSNEIKKYGYTQNFMFSDCCGTDYHWKINDSKGGIRNPYNITFGEWFEKNVSMPFICKLLWYGSSIFGVNVYQVLQRPKSYYKKLLDTTTYDSNPIEAHFLERSWFYIMNLHKLHGSKIGKIGIQGCHVDETDILVNLFRHHCNNIRNLNVDTDHISDAEKCDIVIVPAHPMSKPYTDIKKFMFTIVNSSGLSYVFDMSNNKNYMGTICFSLETHQELSRRSIKSIFCMRRYNFDKTMIQSNKITTKNVLSLIIKYSIFSSRCQYNGQNAHEEFRKIVNASPSWHIINYGDPEVCNDVLTLKEYRYLMHIKYWGHVCNAVVKALALGIPVLMDRATMNIGKYAAYVQHGHNGLVFETTKDIIDYLNDHKRENETYEILKMNCLAEADKYHFSQVKEESNIVSHFWGY